MRNNAIFTRHVRNKHGDIPLFKLTLICPESCGDESARNLTGLVIQTDKINCLSDTLKICTCEKEGQRLVILSLLDADESRFKIKFQAPGVLQDIMNVKKERERADENIKKTN